MEVGKTGPTVWYLISDARASQRSLVYNACACDGGCVSWKNSSEQS